MYSNLLLVIVGINTTISGLMHELQNSRTVNLLKPYFCFNLLKKNVAKGISTRIPSNMAYRKKGKTTTSCQEIA